MLMICAAAQATLLFVAVDQEHSLLKTIGAAKMRLSWPPSQPCNMHRCLGTLLGACAIGHQCLPAAHCLNKGKHNVKVLTPLLGLSLQGCRAGPIPSATGQQRQL